MCGADYHEIITASWRVVAVEQVDRKAPIIVIGKRFDIISCLFSLSFSEKS